MQAATHTLSHWTSRIHLQKEWAATLHSLSSRVELESHYPGLPTCCSQKSIPMYTEICRQQRQNKQALSSNRRAKELKPLQDVVHVPKLPGHSRWFKAQVSGQEAPDAPIKSTRRMAKPTVETVHIFTELQRTFKRCQTET